MKALQVALFVIFFALCFVRASADEHDDEVAAMTAIRTHIPALSSYWTASGIATVCQTVLRCVICSNGHVSGLDFSQLSGSQGTSGTLGNITGLKFLKSLNLETYLSIADLDIWYKQLPALESLSFSNIRASTVVAPVFSADFTLNPFFSHLYFEDISSSPTLPEFTNAPNLRELTLSLPNLGNMRNDYFVGKNLTKLSLHRTGSFQSAITLLPDFSPLTYLETLDLSYTAITSLVNGFAPLVKLRYLHLDACYSLTKIPASVSNCVNLEYFSCRSCQLNLVDSLPNFSATRLNTLRLYGNSISAWPTGLCQLSTNPQAPGLSIDLAFNPMVDPPACFANIPQLVEVSFSDARFTTFPTTFATMTSITSLIMTRCSLMTGSIPNLSGMTSLVYLYLSNNTLTGYFPVLPSSIQQVDISFNQLIGVIPDNMFIGKTYLGTLIISNNTFVGPFPSSIGGPVQIRTLEAANNGFTALPITLGYNKFIYELDFSNNNLQSIPGDDSWRNMTTLQKLNLRGNRNLNRPVLVFWSEPSFFGSIDLSGCSFTGNVPSINNNNLYSVKLSDNVLDGIIMPVIDGSNVNTFRVDRNSLSGSLPSSIGQSATGFVQMNFFDVSYNRLTGSIPTSFWSVAPGLREVRFNNNGIDGSIPPLSSFSEIAILEGHKTNIRLCDANPNFRNALTHCLLYDVSFPGSCGCESWYTSCTTNTTCPAPDYIAPVTPPGTAAPTPILPPSSLPHLPPGVIPPLPDYSPSYNPPTQTPPPPSQTPSQTPSGSGTGSQNPTGTGAAVSTSINFSVLILAVLLFGVLL